MPFSVLIQTLSKPLIFQSERKPPRSRFLDNVQSGPVVPSFVEMERHSDTVSAYQAARYSTSWRQACQPCYYDEHMKAQPADAMFTNVSRKYAFFRLWRDLDSTPAVADDCFK